MKLIENSSVFYNPHTGLTQISYWVLVGPVVFFVIAFSYFVAQRVIDESRKTEHIVGIKSSIIGFSLWFIVIISTYLVNIRINVTTNLIGGYATMLLVMYYMEKCVNHNK